MEAVFLKILELSCYGSLLILAVLPVRLLLGQAPKWMTCLLWAMVAVALICPVRIESPASVMPPVSVENAYTANIPDTAEPSTVTIPTEHRHQTAPTVMDTDTPTVTAEAPRSPVEIASMVWVCGMGLMLLYAILSVLRLRKRVGASLPTGNNVYLCDDIETPFILGLLRPRIYLPSAIDEDTAHQVLLHERAHLHRRDHWWKPLGYVLLTVHWFNPLVWVGYVLLCRDIELACDEKVVRDMAAVDKKRYTEALLTCSVPRHLIAACPLAFGEIGVKQRIKAVLNYKKPAFWVIIVAVLVCIALCLGFLTAPISDKEPDAFASYFHTAPETLRKITVEGDSDYEFVTASDIQRLCGVLGALQFSDTPTDADGLSEQRRIILETTEHEEIYLIFSRDYTTVKVSANGTSTDTYEVLNPETLQQSDFPQGLYWSETAIFSAIGLYLNDCLLPASNLTILHQQIDGNGIYAVVSFSLADAPDQLCLVQLSADNGSFTVEHMVSGQWAGTAGIYPNMTTIDGQTILWTDVKSNAFQTYRVVFESGWGALWSIPENAAVYVLPEGETPVQLIPLDSEQKEVPALAFGAEDFSTEGSLPETPALHTMEALRKSVEASLNSGDIDYSVTNFSDDFTNATGFTGVAEFHCCITESGEILANHPVSFFLSYENGKFSLGYAVESALAACILPAANITVNITPEGSDSSTPLRVYISPDTCHIRSVNTLIPEQPTAAQLQAAIEEHLRNKNRHYQNLRILGDAFYDPNTKAYFLLTAMDYTSADGTVLSENNLQLVSVMDFDSFLRIDGIVSGEWAKSAGIYPNVADFNGQLVLWTTRSDTHIKVSEDGTSVDADASEPNNIYKYKIYCENGNTHTWTLMDHGGVFILPEGDIPISVVPLDDRYNEILALGFGEESLDSTNVYTISEASGWDIFLNMDIETGEISEVCSYPLYIDMDDSFADHAALYSAMKDCEKLPDISWSSLKLAGTLTYEGYEYAAMRYTEGREPMALLVEYQTNADGTVTLLNCAKGYVPDEQGFLTGYRMNQSSMSCGTVYWSLFDTRYATSKNGKETNPDKSVEPAFTSFRFTMRDLKTHDFPVEGNFFMAKFAPVIPPAIVTPLEGKTLLAALGSEPIGGLTGTITLS